ncbi:GNAT family N-acetyltransferase [Exiguobacterium aurantiacum]|uniref:GNAT family N-acetyltransferase n=1 Tax=Exiguobacterium aurantiacum TaxID=33987 RepID=A0ABY5FNX2_9BACL|nr:GNAT family N-acetyltransferase [Exiguobacterium aurantiacum]UTT43210.1 GNAT family N-acetyltransferase [Exiguobacterium aurantiacum]
MNIRPYEERDFDQIQALNETEGWSQLVRQHELTKQAWRQSNVAYVVESEGQVIAYLRGLTDTTVSLYVCELLIAASHRRLGIGERLLSHVHALYPETRLEMLASASSQTYYEKLNFRPFYGYRKTIHE